MERGGPSSRLSATTLLAGTVFDAAQALLGCRISTDFGGHVTEVAITEVEAYAGADDPASHAFRDETPRNRSMFGPPGTLYVYRSYGIHWCMNVVTGEVGLPHAVLLRGGEPLRGLAKMVERRGRSEHVADGPGKLCQALGVTGDCDGSSVVDGPVRLMASPRRGDITTTPRIGVSRASGRLWRYVLGDKA